MWPHEPYMGTLKFVNNKKNEEIEDESRIIM